MNIKEIKLINFRNYKELELKFCKNYNIIYGKNAQGKTNILEAIFLCSAARSHRTSKDNELIKFFENSYYIKVVLEKQYSDFVIEIYYIKDQRKRIKLNGMPLKKSGELMGQLNTVMFSPEDLSIIKSGPSERRRFIDIAISQIKPTYFFNLQQYSRILIQRNNLLKSINISSGKENRKKDALNSTLEVWNDKLIEVGSKIMLARSEYLLKLNEIAKDNHYKLTGKSEEINLTYNPSIKIKDLMDIDIIKDSFREKILTNEEKEIKNGTTLFGPQRDDIEIMVNNKNVRIYGSQGQQRTTALSLKLSEIEILKEALGEYPVLLLDDIFSELDSERQKHIIGCLKDTQVFITSTEKILNNELIKKMERTNQKLYFVENGTVKEEHV